MSLEAYNDQFYVPGWIDDQDSVRAAIDNMFKEGIFGSVSPYAEDTDAASINKDEIPKTYYPWKIFQLVTLYAAIVYNQGQVGSCVGFGTTSACETTLINSIYRDNGTAEDFHHLCQEVTYGGSRFEVNGNRLPFRGDGSQGVWACSFVTKWGVINRGIHGKYDLTRYTESNARLFGSRGVPDDLEPKVKEHPVEAFALVRDWDTAVKLMAQGYGISICSNYGFGSKNSSGVASRRGVWNHCMELWGYDLTKAVDKEEIGLLRNSWSPQAHPGAAGPGDPPKGTFWARASDLNGMLRQGDSYAFARVKFDRVKPIDIDYRELT